MATQAFVLGSQEYGEQIMVGPGRQLPWPSQTSWPVTASPSQAPVLQTVPLTCLRQAPAPSHLPSNEQVLAAAASQSPGVRGFAPLERATHVLSDPVWPQVRQPPVHASLQQTPSTQKLLAQSEAQPHG